MQDSFINTDRLLFELAVCERKSLKTGQLTVIMILDLLYLNLWWELNKYGLKQFSFYVFPVKYLMIYK